MFIKSYGQSGNSGRCTGDSTKPQPKYLMNPRHRRSFLIKDACIGDTPPKSATHHVKDVSHEYYSHTVMQPIIKVS